MAQARVEGDTVIGYRKYSGSFVWRSNLDLKGQDIDFYDDGVTVRVRFEPYFSEKVGMLAVTGFRAESRPGGEVRFSWDRLPFASRYALYSDTSSNLIVRGSKFLRNSVGVRVSSVSNSHL